MSIEHSDTIITLGHSGVDQYDQIDLESLQRVEAAAKLFDKGVANTITMSGFKPFTNMSAEHIVPEADAMKQAAIELGVPEVAILTETKSLDTIGNAYFVKKNILEPNSWGDITVVTSPSHLERSERIFKQVLGKDYKVSMSAANEAPRKAQGVYEYIGMQLEQQVLNGVEEGNDAEAYARLKYLIPGYTDKGIVEIFKNHVKRLGRPSRLLK